MKSSGPGDFFWGNFLMTNSVFLIVIELFRSSLSCGISCVIFGFWDLIYFIDIVIFVCRAVHSIIPSLSILCLQGLKRQPLFLTSPLSFVVLVICVFHLIILSDLIEVSQFSWSLKKKRETHFIFHWFFSTTFNVFSSTDICSFLYYFPSLCLIWVHFALFLGSWKGT